MRFPNVKKGKKANQLLKKAAALLEEKPEPPAPADEKLNPPETKAKSVLSETRKRALINYMAILFSVAFLLVALSLGIEYRDSQATISQLGANASSAMEKADKLQEENRLLQQGLQDLKDQMEILSEQLADTQAALTDAENEGDILSGTNQELLQEKLDAENRANAYQLLVKAQNALYKGNNASFLWDMTELADLSGCLDTADQIIYQELLTHVN